jgi:hypothetical protein
MAPRDNIHTIAEVLRIPVGTRLRLVRSLLGPCDKRRTVIQAQSRGLILRVEDDGLAKGESSWLRFSPGDKIEPRINGFAVLTFVDDAHDTSLRREIAAEYQFVHEAEVWDGKTAQEDA